MGRSMARINPAEEPPDAVYDHPPSKRRYQVVRKNGQVWHRELLLTDGKDEILLCEYPLKYVIGSGRHSRTYGVEVDGFLVESPLTWYTSKQAWGMSPGYDTDDQIGFERGMGDGCLICHAGRSEAVDRSLNKIRIDEAAIGCERCHGPGSLHLAKHGDRKPSRERAKEEMDYTIVNPAHLTRDLAESICQQCHLRINATVIARGRKVADFRPGLPLVEFRQDYRLEVPDAPMTVTGHVEQMHLSKCYQKTSTFTCVTCHDPHGEPHPKEHVEYYRAVCLNCHEKQACKVTPAQLKRESPINDCITCHMPRSPTDIPHLAFTHHRIGHHAKTTTKEKTRPGNAHGTLSAFLDSPRMSELDRNWSAGIGYLEATNKATTPTQFEHYHQQAFSLLTKVRDAGLREATMEVTLARVKFDRGWNDEAREHAELALKLDQLDGQDRCVAMAILADMYARNKQYAQAVEVLSQLVKLRWASQDWLLMADCQRGLGNQAGFLNALKTAARINPRNVKVQGFLANYYARQGDEERARYHKVRAQ
jgi:predicted CXXCH cytochrome family protein